MTTGTKTIKQKLFFSAMVLAFMWVILGDLVTIHLEVYFGKKIESNWHNPFAKTHKDDTAVYKTKQHKTDSGNKHLDFVDETGVLLSFQITNKSINYFDHQFATNQQPQCISLRGPPSLI